MRLVTAVVFVAGLSGLMTAPVHAAPVSFEIQLLDRQWSPPSTLGMAEREALVGRALELHAAGVERLHVLVQLNEVPDSSQRAQLRSEGLDLGGYVPNRAFIAALPVNAVASLIDHPAVRWMTLWDTQLKLHPRIKADVWPSWALTAKKPGWVMTFVQLHHDVDLERLPQLVKASGGIAGPLVSGLHGATVWLEKANVEALAAEEAVLWIEHGPPPMSETNDGIRATMEVDTVHQAPYNLDGTGVRPFVYDGGSVRATHETFDPGTGSRMTVIDSAGLSNHATHVSGTLGGDGLPSGQGGRAMGMAPGSTMFSAGFQWNGVGIFFWDNAGDIEADYALARNTHDADLGNNSIGSNTASNGWPCDITGDYGVASELLDGMVRGDNSEVGSPVLLAWANGNERTGGSPSGRCGPTYYSTAPPACAKNPIHVGATYSDGDAITNFTSWGPCDDGRLKPTVTAPGCETGRVNGESGIYSSTGSSDTAYSSGFCGTSMASPAVAGVATLFIEDWRSLGYGGPLDRPLPALVKAMMMQSARDRGQDGPDYVFGYGSVDAHALIDLLRGGSALGSDVVAFGEDSVDHAQVDSFQIDVPAGATELKASLAWDDAASVAFTVPNLVNDLDLELEAPDTTVHRSWTLDHLNPAVDATTGVNTIDNQEQVIVEDPAEGTWTVRVTGTSVPTGPQTYGLAYSAVTEPEGACTELISNGGFETNTAGWVLSGTTAREAAPAGGHGSFSLRLGGSTTTDEAYTEVSIPENSGIAELTYFWYMTSAENPLFHAIDYFWVEVRDTADNQLAVFDRLSADYARDLWYGMGNIDMSPWAGQTVRVTVQGTNNNGTVSTYWLDDVSLRACQGGDIFADGFESGDTSSWSNTVP